MSILQITDTEEAGELRWGITLVNDEGTAIMQNRTPLAQGVANSTAKVLIHKGPDAPTLEKVPGGCRRRAGLDHRQGRPSLDSAPHADPGYRLLPSAERGRTAGRSKIRRTGA